MNTERQALTPTMMKQESLRPHDVCVALQLALRPHGTFRELSASVGLSLGEAHNSAKRLEDAHLVNPRASQVNIKGLIEFLSFGVPYVFPAQLGMPSQGIPTAFSVEPLSKDIVTHDKVVWPSPSGPIRGLSLVPLCQSVVDIWQRNAELYRLITLVDAIRVGRARERRLARSYLDKALLTLGQE